ncbi:hypothetical protein L228DRAFT_246636 [Xylona heveae TC161]|uniref:C3H1-type domain-containing protein n=1 Tax=Xylona heveae (strain CBS 132557 / TC161) TaxID=1328760 RepID=A0A165HP48_XYLHT|nr:hypothetical protein L228DRAFT_246636 [Xylona heveae TC161]KZF23792.1 hypothetical protein L228DRAFT_246636 [Xylona heveae TC161]
MSSNNFTFPPPPPPPPKAAGPDQNNNTQRRNNFGNRGGQGARGNRGRGRGDGHGFSRGTSYGGRGGAFTAQRSSGYAAPSTLNAQPPTYPHTRYPHTGFPPATSPQATPTGPYPPTNFPQQYASQTVSAQNGVPGYSNVPLPYGASSQPLHNNTNIYTPPSWPAATQSVPAYTPMHMGYDQNYPANAPYNAFRTPGNDHAPRGGKRSHGSAVPKPKAPPAVPSFGAPLPLKPPAPEASDNKQSHKRRKFNLLGLTPRGEEHEESEEDVDEEAAFSGAAVPAEKLQFTYRGQTSTLNNPTDLAAWIEERRKRYPTQKRVEEKKSQQQRILEEAKQKRKEALQARNKQRKEKEIPPEQAAAKARVKAEKRRRKKLRKDEQDSEANPLLDNLEAKLIGNPADPSAGWTIPDSAATIPTSGTTDGNTPLQPPAPEPIPIPESPHISEPRLESQSKPAETSHNVDNDDGNVSDASSDISDLSISSSSTEPSPDEDETSSSGSSSDEDEDAASDSDASAPEETSTRRTGGPERVPPPKREKREQVCKYFSRSGGCKRGNKCAFKHEHAPGAAQVAADKAARRQAQLQEKSGGRKTLHQRLLDRQQEEEDMHVVQAIKFLGERGFLTIPVPLPGPSPNPGPGPGPDPGPGPGPSVAPGHNP